MALLMILIAVGAYAWALYLWVRQRSYRYAVALVAGHTLAAGELLWMRLYDYGYQATTSDISVAGQNLPIFVIIMAGWLYTLPALLIFYSQKHEWWPRHYVFGIIGFVTLWFYHLIIRGLLGRFDALVYGTQAASWGTNYQLVMAMLGALVSLLILYMLIATRHYAAEMIVPVYLVGTFLIGVLVYGILGAPFWLAKLIESGSAFEQGGLIVTIGLTLWVTHLASMGLHNSRSQQVRWG